MKRLSVFAAVLLLSCARVVAPSGGPEDKEAPQVVSISPEPGFVDSIPALIRIEYSEKILADENSFQIYPGADDVTVNSRGVEIKPGFTAGVIAVTVPGDIRDRRGNSSGTPLTVVWNTVPENDFSAVRVRVSRTGGGSVSETSRCDMYLLPDTSTVLLTGYPDSTDSFVTGWLPYGEYLLYCYEDNDRSLSWDMLREPGALREVTLTAGDTVSVDLSMTIADSIGPAISAVTVMDGWHLEILWNEQVSDSNLDPGSITIMAPDSSFLEIFGLGSAAGRSSTGRSTVYTDRMADTMYTVAVEGILDLSGNPSLPDTLEVWGTDSLPSSVLSIRSSYPEDGGNDIPPGGPFSLSFSDWIPLSDLDSLYSVTLVSDSSEVSGTLTRLSPLAFAFHPEFELLGQRQYRVDLDSGLVSLQGDTLAGRSWTFTPAWSDKPGEISGRITGTGASAVTLLVSSAGGESGTMTGTFAPGDYTIADIPGGRYTAACFVDWNSNEIWDPGEPYGAWPGVVEVFPGIETTDINIQVVP